MPLKTTIKIQKSNNKALDCTVRRITPPTPANSKPGINNKARENG